jgi:hypothetical protein
MTVIHMSGEELSRLRIMINLADGRLTVEAAAALMDPGRQRDSGRGRSLRHGRTIRIGRQTLCGRPRGFKSIERILTDGSTAFMCSACCRGA